MPPPPAKADACRSPGCPNPRTTHSIYCDPHHLQQLTTAEQQTLRLPFPIYLRLLTGPISLNLARISAATIIFATLPLTPAITTTIAIAHLSAIAGWRKSRRLVDMPPPQAPIAHLPGLQFLIYIALYSTTLMLTTGLLIRLIQNQ